MTGASTRSGLLAAASIVAPPGTERVSVVDAQRQEALKLTVGNWWRGDEGVASGECDSREELAGDGCVFPDQRPAFLYLHNGQQVTRQISTGPPETAQGSQKGPRSPAYIPKGVPGGS